MEDKEIPFEVLDEIFRYLNHEDLWRCLSVSKTWRDISNSNLLWKIQCDRLGIEEPSRNAEGEGYNDLCLWATTYVTHYLMPLKNWRTGNCKVFEVKSDCTPYIDMWEGNKGVVYYYKRDELMIYEVDLDRVNSFKFSCFKNLPRELFTISIGLGSNYIAVSNYNTVVIFKRNSSSYEPVKAVILKKEEVHFVDYDEKFIKSAFSLDASLHIKALLKGYLWLRDNYNDRLYIINVASGHIKAYDGSSYFRYTVNIPYIASWNDESIKLHERTGKVVFRSKINCWDLCFNRNIVVIGNKHSQTVETYSIKTNERYISKSVLYHTDMVVHPNRDLIVLAEKSKITCRFTCLDAIHGYIIWHMFPPPDKRRCHDLKIVSDCLFIWHSFLTRPEYSIHDVCNGRLISQGLIPENRCHFSDTFWVYFDYDHFKIKSYIGFN